MRPTLLLTTLLLAPAAGAQELVLNGGFETHARCPDRFDEKSVRTVAHVRPWGGMPGYFHRCADLMGTPTNWAGTQPPYEGDAYVGLVLTAHGGGECAIREFVQLELATPLVNGCKYRLSFRASLADRSGYMTDRIGACFSKTDRTGKKGTTSSYGRPDVDNPLNRFLADTAGWMLVEGLYSARGGERFIQIGNFQLCDRTSRKAVTANKDGGVLHNMKHKGDADLDPDKARGLRRKLLATQAYVYIDAVSLVVMSRVEATRVLDPLAVCPEDPGRPGGMVDLVPDPGFDTNLPTHRSVWKNASGGTPDLLEGVTGLYLHSAVNKDHREYIHTPLREQLDPCGTYDVQLRVRRDASYGYAVDRIGVALTATFEPDRRRGLLEVPLRWEVHGQGVMDEVGTWTTLCGTLAGGGCANRLLLGNFASDDSTVIVQRDVEGGPFAYYFIDDVSLWRTGTVVGCTLQCPEAITAIPLGSGMNDTIPQWPLVLRFEVNDHVPGEELMPVAEDLLHALIRSPNAQIRIAGHTDASGNEQANLDLSEKRAEAVRNELIRLGLSASRTTVVALGSTEPMATNTSAEGRALNRRVEITLVGPAE